MSTTDKADEKPSAYLAATKAKLVKSVRALEDECDLLMELILRKNYKTLSHNRISGSLKRRRHDEIPKIPEVPSVMRKRQCSSSVGVGEIGNDYVNGQSDMA